MRHSQIGEIIFVWATPEFYATAFYCYLKLQYATHFSCENTVVITVLQQSAYKKDGVWH